LDCFHQYFPFFCLTTIKGIYERWDQNPVIVTFAEKAMSISKIPFPAITVCPKTKFEKDALNFTKFVKTFRHNKKDTLTPEELKIFEVGAQICEPKVQPFKEKLSNMSTLKSEEIVREIIIIRISILSKHFVDCNWRQVRQACDVIFTAILTQ
jgi:acid-sensing ion channel, other